MLFRVVRDHLETFCAQSASIRDGEGLPRFVYDECRDYLSCGWLAGGFARFRCAACGTNRLVAFSCKGRGFCPNCGARRMAEDTAHLVFDPLELLERLAVITPRPRINLILYHGILGARSGWRRQVVAKSVAHDPNVARCVDVDGTGAAGPTRLVPRVPIVQIRRAGLGRR